MRIILFTLAVMLLSSCGGPNRAYLAKDWDRFQTACESWCAPEPAEPTRSTTPWLCGCDKMDEILEDMY